MHTQDMKPLSIRTVLYWMGVLSARLWNKVPTNYDEKKMPPTIWQKKKESCLNLSVTGTYFLNYYTPSPHNLEGINLQNIHSK